MQTSQRLFMFLLISIIFPFASLAETGPMETIQTRIDAAILILKDPAYENPDPALFEEQHQKLSEHTREIFDFKTIAMLATGRNWQRFSEAQRQEFIGLFAKVLTDSYLSKVQGNYNDEKLIYDSEDIISPNRAEVRSRITYKDKEIPILYKLRTSKNGWLIYDVQIEGISLVQNYRSQFADLLLKEEPEDLIRHMRKKVQELETDRMQHTDKKNSQTEMTKKPSISS